MKKHIRKITRASSHSYSINIPKEIVEKYGFRVKQKLWVVDKGRGRIEIKDWKK